jgi:deoxyribonuclease-4
VDRHAGIGQGQIGRGGFRHIVNDGRFLGLPGCLETPKSDDLHEDVQNLRVLRSLVKASRKARVEAGSRRAASGARRRTS